MNTLHKYFVPSLLILGTLILAFWMVMARANRRGSITFDLTSDDLAAFHPAMPGWTVVTLPITRDNLIDANIGAYTLVREAQVAGKLDTLGAQATSPPPVAPHRPSSTRFLVRLVHGYNMPMCMKLKDFTVEKIQDNRIHTVSNPKLKSSFSASHHQLDNLTTQQLHEMEFPVQLWRLTSSVGTVSIWVTTMIRSDDFSSTSEDICSMAFPRVNVSGDPGWVPRGLEREHLIHPVNSFKRWYHSRWDSARWDVWTFLRLRRPVGASNDLLSYITRVENLPSDGPRDVDIRDLLEIHAGMLKELQVWRTLARKEGLYH